MRVISDAYDTNPAQVLRSDDRRFLVLKESNLCLILNKLEALKLIRLRQLDHTLYEIGRTKQGMVYFELSSQERRNFWKRSVWIPFGVSLATSLLSSGVIWLVKFLITGSWV